MPRSNEAARSAVQRRLDKALSRLRKVCNKALGAAPGVPGEALSVLDVATSVADLQTLLTERSSAFLAIGVRNLSGLLALYALALRHSSATLEPDTEDELRRSYYKLRTELVYHLELAAKNHDKGSDCQFVDFCVLMEAFLRSHALRYYGTVLHHMAHDFAPQRQRQPLQRKMWSTDVQLQLLLGEVRVLLMPLSNAAIWYYKSGREHPEHFPQQELQASALLEHWARGTLLVAGTEGSALQSARALWAMTPKLSDLKDKPAAYLACSPSLSYLLSSHLVGVCAALDGGTTYGMPSGPGAAVAPLFTVSGQPLRPGATEELGTGLAVWACSLWTRTLGHARELLHQSWAELSPPTGVAAAEPADRPTVQEGDALPAPSSPPPPPHDPSAGAAAPGPRPMPLHPALRDCLQRLEQRAAAMRDQQRQQQQAPALAGTGANETASAGVAAGPSGAADPSPTNPAQAPADPAPGAAASEQPQQAADSQGPRSDQADAQHAGSCDIERLGARAEELRGLLGGRTLMPLHTRAAFSVGSRLAASCVEALLADRQAAAATAAAGIGPGRPEWRPRLAPADAAALGVEALRCAAAACAEAAALPYSQAPPAALRPLVSLAKTRLTLAAAVADLGPSVLHGRDELLGSALKLWRPPTPDQKCEAPEQPQEPSAGLVTSLAAGYMRGLEVATRSCNRDMILEVTRGTIPHVWTQALALAPPREAASLLASLAKVLRSESAGLLEAAATQLAVNAVATDPGGSGGSGGSKGSGGNVKSGGDSARGGSALRAPGCMTLYVNYAGHAEMLPVAKCFLGLGLDGWDWLRRVAAGDAGRGGPTWEASAADSTLAAVSVNGSERWSVRSGAHSGHMASGSDGGGAGGRSIGPASGASGNAGGGGSGAASDGGQTGGGGGGGGTRGSSSGGGAGARVDTRSALSGRALARSASCAVVHLGPALSLVLRRMRACDGALGDCAAWAQRDVAAALLSLVPVLAVAAAADAAGRSPRAATGTGLGHRDGGVGQGGDGDGSSNTAGGSGGGTYDSSSGVSADGSGIAGGADCGSAVIRDSLASGTDGRQLDGGRQPASAAAMAAAEWRRFLLCDVGLREVLGAALGLTSSVPAREREHGEAELQAALASCLRALAWLLPGQLAGMLAAEGQVEAAEGGQEAGAAAPSVAAPALSQLRALLGPGGSMADPELLAAVEAACGGDGSRGVGAEAKPLPADVGEWAPLASLLVPPSAVRAALPVCSNPLCTNLEGGSEAALRLHGCAGCGEVARYCSRSCQVAHWRAGHSKECTGKGGAAAVGAGGL